MHLTSSGFEDGGMIAGEYTCKGVDLSPGLEWKDVPRGTRGFALVCDDPDAPMGDWVHWVYYDIPGDKRGLPENVEKVGRPRTGGKQGLNDFRRTGYNGPCPPDGTHRYYFKLYALDTLLNLPEGATRMELLRAMEGHVLDEALLMGRFSR